ncbi:MAG TPA: histidine kinase [Chitinophagaceae bacterium]|jgi:ligand-binding sensor domain-containing protein/putative methionine-R-sulfoxide reductase with GAF domain/anti-sigma regulatory factor (Ser/Thr protein kinase)|nr:histidine kinase [Chitinophagaceae bacterium]
MVSKKKIVVLTVFFITGCLFQSLRLYSQQSHQKKNILFYQLNASHGLSDNYISDLCTDKNGCLWVVTGDGLNMFNGKKVTRFFKQEYPQLKSDNYKQVICDENNRIWVMSYWGDVTLIDENRRFHQVSLSVNQNPLKARWILKTEGQGIMLLMMEGIYSFTGGNKILTKDSITINSFSKIEVTGLDTMQAKGFLQIDHYDDNSYIITKNYGFYKVDLKQKTIGKKYVLPNIDMLTKWGPGDMIGYDLSKSKLVSINLITEEITYPLEGIKDQFGNPIIGKIVNAKMVNAEQLLISSSREGLYIFNTKTKELYNYRHDAADPTSIINNRPNAITFDSTGWVFIGATPNGISYYKTNAVIGQKSFFNDKKGNSYDGYVTYVTSRDNDTYYIGVDNNLLEWKRSTNTTNFIDVSGGVGASLLNREGVGPVCFDNFNRLWICTFTQGIFILDQNKKLVKHLTNDTTAINSIPRGTIRYIKLRPDGYMWIGLAGGLCKINTTNFKVERFTQHPLSAVSKYDCYCIFFYDADNIWIGTYNKGLWHYQPSTQKLTNFNSLNSPLTSDDIFCINKDSSGNLYVGQPTGLLIFFKNGKIKTIAEKEGLLNTRVEVLMLDKRNRMWMGNDAVLSCFNIKDSSLRIFGEQYGLSVQGFRIGAYHQNPDDEMIWGTEAGLQYFYPDELYNYKTDLKVNINRIETRDIVSDLTQSNTYHLAANDNYVTFHFSTLEYLSQLKTFYEYKLEGIDEDWIKVINEDFVRYSSLPSGKYKFKVRASNDNKIWKESENEITIIIASPFYRTWWFKLGGILLSLFLLWSVFKYYRRKNLKTREELETQMVINNFASRINSYQKTEDILWDVAKNCISKLNFEDCVIYLLDEEKNVLVQKAAYGPKMERDFTIYQPIEIPVGKGIVGTVAKTGKPELIANTELDERYIMDDAKRYSEVAVPLIIDDRVIGVIDSEHSKKNFFSQKHLNILSTIAVLCANQIQRANAEEEKQKAKIEVLENKQKVTESRLQSLRLQMNPHFLFNALNSIQQMILANEELVATRFLSRFSKLLRAILINSDKETVTLKEELEILNLYIELEARRFKDSFHYRIECDEEIDQDEIKIPTLLIQPFVENAIWHGLMHKEERRNLNIRFSETGDFLQCIIEDNGVGRKKSEEVKKANGQDKGHISKGIKVSLERLKTTRNKNGKEGSLDITDLFDENGQAAGTRVIINFPVQN